MIYLKNNTRKWKIFSEMILLHSFMKKKLLLIPVNKHRWPKIPKPLHILTPSVVVQQSWEECLVPWCPTTGSPKLPSPSPSPPVLFRVKPDLQPEEIKPHVMGIQLTRVYSNCSELNNKHKYVFDKDCSAWASSSRQHPKMNSVYIQMPTIWWLHPTFSTFPCSSKTAVGHKKKHPRCWGTKENPTTQHKHSFSKRIN